MPAKVVSFTPVRAQSASKRSRRAPKESRRLAVFAGALAASLGALLAQYSPLPLPAVQAQPLALSPQGRGDPSSALQRAPELSVAPKVQPPVTVSRVDQLQSVGPAAERALEPKPAARPKTKRKVTKLTASRDDVPLPPWLASPSRRAR